MNILAVHNHPEFVSSLSEAIDCSSHYRDYTTPPHIVEANSLAQALKRLSLPDPIALILISMDLAQHESSAWMTAIHSHQPQLPILFVTDIADHEQVGKVIARESVSCPFDSPSGRIVLNAILIGVSRNLTQAQQSATQAKLATPDSLEQPANNATTPLSQDNAGQNKITELESRLTPRQWEVLCLLRDGHSNKTIARILNLAEGTVKIHCLAIYRVLGVSNRTQAAMHINHIALSV